MPRIDEDTKTQRKERAWIAVQRHPQGITEAEVADFIVMSDKRRTVNSYLRELEDEGKVYKDGRHWFPLDYIGTRLKPFDLSPEEAITLYLAARLLTKQQDKRNEPAETALLKLAHVLTSNAGVGQEIVQAAQELARRAEKSGYQTIFRTIVRGYLYRKQVKISYRPLRGKPFETTFATYLIEPSAIGFSTYIIGHSSIVGDLRSYKLERVETAALISEEYAVPETFPGLDILRNSWSIISGEQLERVVLRFSPDIKDRVLETVWHPSQQRDDDAEKPGYLRWWVDVAGVTDITPFVRGWGADVEVVEPAHLRQHLIDTVVRLGEQYQVRPPSQRQPYQWLYAKTDRKNPDNIHLLLYHLIDVGQVALEMWNEVFPESLRNHIAQQLGVTIKEAGRFIAFVSGLHDLGKASPAYQKKYSPFWLKEKLAEVGFELENPRGYSPETNDKMTSHAYITTWALPPLLVEYCELDEQFSRKIGQALGGHHGAWPINSVNFNFDDSACEAWNTARCELVWELRNVFQPPSIPKPPTGESLNVFLTLFSGLTSVADWLGSRDDHEAFPLVKDVLTTREYVQRSKSQARRVLHDLGWKGWQPTHTPLDFVTMFQYLDDTKTIQPRPVQQQIIDLTADLTTPSLIIIEAPTGIGKTEIAFYLADTLLQNHHGRGLYIAMPTQATSNQMFDRTTEFLAQRYPKDVVDVHLAHGQAVFQERVQAISLQTIGDEQEDGRIVAMSWFNEKSKRTLLAPFGVGTVDQTLMSVLQTKHFFVRLLGLSHKVVIFDEVHAYDTYMDTLFVQLLQWLRAIGTSVIMLSATLPAETRQKFVHAFTGERPQLANYYPAVTIASPDKPAQIHQLPPPDDIVLAINWLAADQTIEHILSLAGKGGCIAVICNTVVRSQTIFRQLLEAREDGKLHIERDNLILFHARFPPIWRKEIEDKTKRLFGKPQKDEKGNLVDYRPPKGPAIIIATQVIEQSLDLDFDAMITSLAPMDLLIQRAGRLHRHKIRDGQRHGHARQLTIIQPELDKQSIPHFGDDEYIYERYILLRTYRVLHQLAEYDTISLPRQTIDLIEATYTNDPCDKDPVWREVLTKAFQKMDDEQFDAERRAESQLILGANNPKLLYETNRGLEEDNPTIHQTFQAKTRDIGPTLTLICLHATEKENCVALDPQDNATVFDQTMPPDLTLTKQLLQWRINVQHWTLLNHFLAKDAPPAWRKNSVLRHARLVIFQDGKYRFTHGKNDYILSLDRDYGLRIEKCEKQDY
jgi:CRISPR-associated endonuclease/helicase Cas3